MLERPFSAFLICSQLTSTCSALVGLDVPEHVRMAVHELVVDHARDVGEREPTLLGGEGGVEEHLEEQVAELLLEVTDGLGRSVEAVDRFEHLVGLLEQMAGERAMGLLPIPRALTAQGAHELRKANELGRDGCVQRRDPERGEVVGREGAVELGPLELEDLFVGQTEVMEHDDAVGRPRRRRA